MNEVIKYIVIGAAISGSSTVLGGVAVGLLLTGSSSRPSALISVQPKAQAASRALLYARQSEQTESYQSKQTQVPKERGTLNHPIGKIGVKSGQMISFDEASADFGDVDQGTESVKTFVYRNKGDQLLKIGAVSTSCGCTVAEPTPREVEPGKFGLLKVSFKSGNFRGAVTKTITVPSNDPLAPSITLELKANIRRLFDVEPKIAAYGEIERGKPARQEVKIKSATGEPFVLKGATSTHPALKVEVLTPDPAAKNEARVVLTMDTKRNYGPFAYGVHLHMLRPQQSGNRVLEVTVPATGTVLGPVRVTPQQIYMGLVPDGAKFSPQKLTVKNVGTKPVEITSVETGFEGMKAHVKPVKPGLEYEIALVNEEAPPTGFFQKTVLIKTSDSDVPTEVRLTGVVSKKPLAANTKPVPPTN